MSDDSIFSDHSLDAEGALFGRLGAFLSNLFPSAREKPSIRQLDEARVLSNNRLSAEENLGDMRLDEALDLAERFESLMSPSDERFVEERTFNAGDTRTGLESKNGFSRYFNLQGREYSKSAGGALRVVKTVSEGHRDVFTLGRRLVGLNPMPSNLPLISPSINTPLHSRELKEVCLEDFLNGMSKKEKKSFRTNSDIVYHKIYISLLWTFESLDEDADLERFFEGLSRLCNTQLGRELKLQKGFIAEHKMKLSGALIGLMNRTLSSNLDDGFVKQRRMIICTKVVHSTSLLGPWWMLRCVLLGGWSGFLECVEFGLFVQNWKSVYHKVTSFYAQCVAALTISYVRHSYVRHDGRWLQLAGGLLKVTKPLLHEYIARGDSILLANAIFIVRRTVQTYSGAKERLRQDILGASSKTLETVCKLNIGGTLPELQHEFCILWNQLVLTAKTDERAHHVCIAEMMLKNIRKLYIALHGCPGTPPTADCGTTDDPDAILDHAEHYSMCTDFDHIPAQLNPDLQFDEPDLDDPPTPNMTISMPSPVIPYTPGKPSNFTTPYYFSSPPAPYLSSPSHYGPSFAFTPSHSPAPSLDATIRFPGAHMTRSYAPNGLRAPR